MPFVATQNMIPGKFYKSRKKSIPYLLLDIKIKGSIVQLTIMTKNYIMDHINYCYDTHVIQIGDS